MPDLTPTTYDPDIVHSTARTPESGVKLEEALYALDLVINKMNVPGLSGQRAYAEDVLKRAAQLDGLQGEGKAL